MICKEKPEGPTTTSSTPPSEGATGPKVNFDSSANGPKTILKKGSAMVTIEEGPQEEEKDESAPFYYDEPDTVIQTTGMYLHGRAGRKKVRSLLDNAVHRSYITQRVRYV